MIAATVDLQSRSGAELVGATWRYADASVREIAFVGVGPDLGPGDEPNRTYDIEPHAQAVDFDDSSWRVLAPEETRLRLGGGRVSFNWYRLVVTIPERVGDFDPTGSTAVFEIVIDDYAEVWVDGELPLKLGQVVGGFNAPNRVVLGKDVRPGDTFSIAVFGINGPISASPHNYIWVRSATLDFVVPPASSSSAERVAGGFVFTEGPVWAPDGTLLFSSPNTNEIYRWDPVGRVDLFMTKSGYAGPNIHRIEQPGSNGLAFDGEGRLVMCQHGNRRVLRVNPHGDTTVLAARFRGRRLNSPNDLVFRRSTGELYFTDPPFGLPAGDPGEIGFAGVYLVRPDGSVVLLDDGLAGPNGIAFSPDERTLYVGNWDLSDRTVYAYDVLEDGTVGARRVLHDMTDAPGEDAVDGLKVDVDGNVYACGPGGVWVLSAAGEHLRTLELPEAPHNLAWGDDDGRTLYITAETSVYRLRMDVEGVR
ncbi:MAG: SMP-30/gluconolactonase/LRE family protein [Actinomycetota bacterium]|nr:SMP-30/gluconolactonase/LRE family protein [Actinomycetota bacterium]MDQ5808906.1 SMP-30/gluconolactonase/LRE family protein [Actinomycetota bacterium]